SVVLFSSRRRHTRSKRDCSSDVCSSDLVYLHRLNTLSIATCRFLEKTLKIFTRESNLTKVRLKLKKLSISYKMKWALKISVSLSLLQLLLSRFLKKELSVWYVLRLIMQSSTTNHLSL